ncbi:MAG: CapA family protein [bacterium]|nr:CapA family protein [bacterium]
MTRRVRAVTAFALLAVVAVAGCGDAGRGPAAPASVAATASTTITAPESDPAAMVEGATTSPQAEAEPAVSPADDPDGVAVSSPASEATTVPRLEPSGEWTLLAGGDVLMDRSEPAGIDLFEFIEPALASADFAVVNVEMAISDRGDPLDKQYVFRAPPRAAERMAAAGIDVANLANNHAKDYGSGALVHTVELLEAAGVVAIGAGANEFEAYRYRVLDTAGGVRVAFVGVSMIVPRGFPAGPDTAGIASARPPQLVLDSVWGAAGAADVVVAVVHWGVERTTCPNAAQRDFARALLDAGATAVIGHHPHVLQPVEFFDGKLVAYSLGNFAWHPRWGITGETGVLEIGFDGARIVDWAFHPHVLNDDGAPVPVKEGTRYQRITDIVSGNCETHQPPPLTTTTTEAQPETADSPPDEPAGTTSTAVPATDTTAATGGG